MLPSTSLSVATGEPGRQHVVAGVVMPPDVAIQDSSDGRSYFLFYAHKQVNVYGRRTRSGQVSYEVYDSRSLYGGTFHTALEPALRTALTVIDTMRPCGWIITHRRDGVYVRTTRGTGTSTREIVLPHGLAAAHRLFVEAARRLDFSAHILRRSLLAPDSLLRIAEGANTESTMRAAVAQIAQRIRDQASFLDRIVRERAGAPVADQEAQRDQRDLRSRRTTNLLTDARYLRAIARVLDKEAAARGPQPGDYCVHFRNAINSYGRETHVCVDVASARELARTHRPFNNTEVRIELVVSLHYDQNITEPIPLD